MFERVKQINILRKIIFKIFFYTDVVQVIGKILVSVQDLGVDYFIIVGYKVYVGKGILNKMYRICFVIDLKNEIYFVNQQYFLWYKNDQR